MNFKLRFIALLLVVIMCLSSCEMFGMGNNEPQQTNPIITEPTESTTTTPTTTKPLPPKTNISKYSVSIMPADFAKRYTLTTAYYEETMALLDQMLEISKTATTIDEIDVIYDEFEERFYHIAQQMTIATIIYYCNTNDYAGIKRYDKATDMFYKLQDKYTETCRSMYKESPFKDELFSDWTAKEIEELLDYDSTVVELRKEIDDLQVEYNKLGDDEFTDGAAAIYAQIVQKNNELAKFYGYNNYYDYATEKVYSRDYTVDSLVGFRQNIIDHVIPYIDNLYEFQDVLRSLEEDEYNLAVQFVDKPFDVTRQGYLVEYLNSLTGKMGESMRHVFDNKNCVFADGMNALPTAFCTYLYEDETPFCLFGQSQSATTIAHEIGHYYASLVNNDLENYDLLETHSQGNEFLFMNYCSDKLPEGVYEVASKFQLINMCFTVIMATIVDEFEYIVYNLESVEGYTSEDFDAIMTTVCEKYGGVNWVKQNMTDPMNYWRAVCIENPVYYISYSVSAIAAIEIGALVETDKEAAYEAYRILVEDTKVEDGFLNALQKAGLASPFDDSTFVDVEAILSR